jgi:hypothetical protein
MNSLGMSSLALSSLDSLSQATGTEFDGIGATNSTSATGASSAQGAQPSGGGSAGFAQVWENAQAQDVAQSFATNSMLDAFSSGAGFMSPANSITV